MLEHQKFVLQAVADQENLFRKELIKSMNWLDEYDQEKLLNWLKERFNNRKDIIDEIVNTSLVPLS
ncbi:hypothetical protein [Marinifilum fragile]|jgi:hypothetical protein|uniref:hypothetical protein n=1 Tax=Marinifilum fragile TaxID=570161 RepID=UPI0006D1B41E|nr:hypothetical protein [Marinifilum fragile]